MSNLDYFSKIYHYASNVHTINTIFQKWGYKAVLIPLIDTASSYAHTSLLEEEVFKTLNKNNEIMLLRSDSTPFLSKILGSHIQKKLLPLRLYYSNSIFQTNIQYDVKQWQSGVELIGVSSPTAEFEVISLLYALTYSLIDNFRIHISSRKLLIELLKQNSTPIDEQEYTDIFSLIILRNIQELQKRLDKHIMESIFYIADNKEYAKWKKHIVSIIDKGMHNTAFLFFTTFFEALLAIDTKHRMCCDLSELGNHHYYTDTVYTVFSPTLATPLAKGGRYDSLLKKYGYDTPAIGFSLYPHLIAHDLIHKNKNPTKEKDNPFHSLYKEKTPSIETLTSRFYQINSE